MIAVIVINYQSIDLTLNCLESLYKNAGTAFHLYLIDNASSALSRSKLTKFLTSQGGNASACFNRDNEGFAGGCNQALKLILSNPIYHAVALLNNDTVIAENWLAIMSGYLEPDRMEDMVACRMMRYSSPHVIDSLGIVFYKTGIGSNRKDRLEPVIGPCGGAAIYSARLLRQVFQASGYYFDSDFFCYAEDTDLALRARSLGFRCAYADDAVVFHYGSHSTGGEQNTFIAYYGLRNSLFTLFKNLPLDFLLLNSFWILCMQFAVMLKYTIKRKPRIIIDVYTDFFIGLPKTLKQRKLLQECNEWRPLDWRTLTSRKFYETGYISTGIQTLFHPNIADQKVKTRSSNTINLS